MESQGHKVLTDTEASQSLLQSNAYQKHIEATTTSLKAELNEHLRYIKNVENELARLQLQLKLNVGPRKMASEFLRGKIEAQNEVLACVRRRHAEAKQALAECEAELHKEEEEKNKLCEELNLLVAESTAAQLAKLEELKNHLDMLNRWGGRMGGQSTSSAEAEGLCQQAHAFAASAGLQLPHPPSSNAPEAHMHAAPVNGTSNVSSRGCAASDPLGTAAAPAQPQPSSSSMEPKPQRNQHAPVQAPSGAAMGAPRTAPHDGPSTAMEPADGCSPSTTGAALAPEQGASSISALTATQPPKGVPRRGGGRKQLTSMRPRPAVPGTGGSTTSPEDPMQGGGSPMAAHPLQHGQPLLSVAQGAAVLQGGPVRSCNPGSREAAARPPLLSPDALSKSTTVQARHGAAESSRQMGVISPAESSRFSGFDV